LKVEYRCAKCGRVIVEFNLGFDPRGVLTPDDVNVRYDGCVVCGRKVGRPVRVEIT